MAKKTIPEEFFGRGGRLGDFENKYPQECSLCTEYLDHGVDIIYNYNLMMICCPHHRGEYFDSLEVAGSEKKGAVPKKKSEAAKLRDAIMKMDSPSSFRSYRLSGPDIEALSSLDITNKKSFDDWVDDFFHDPEFYKGRAHSVKHDHAAMFFAIDDDKVNVAAFATIKVALQKLVTGENTGKINFTTGRRLCWHDQNTEKFVIKQIEPENEDWEKDFEYQTNIVTSENFLNYLDLADETEQRKPKDKEPSNAKENMDSFIKELPDDLDARIKKATDTLCIDEKYIRQIIHHLDSGRHVLIGGAIGTGKSTLVREFLGGLWDDGGYEIDMVTATDEWSTVDVIGGIMPDISEKDLKYKFEDGCLTKAVSSFLNQIKFPVSNGKLAWLAIDEFNRADIEKAFGQLFTAIEDGKLRIPGRVTNRGREEELEIPRQFRIIGMLNTSDKHHLYRLHDALKRRFAYVEIETPTRNDRKKEIDTAFNNAVKASRSPDTDYSSVRAQIAGQMDTAYEMLAAIRTFKGLGTAILKVIYQELIAGELRSNTGDEVLHWSLTANLLPQLQGTNRKTLEVFERIFIENTGSPVDKFNEVIADPSLIEEYSEGWEMFVKFARDDDYVEADILDLRKQRDKIGVFSEQWDERKSKIKFNSGAGDFGRKLRELIDSEDY